MEQFFINLINLIKQHDYILLVTHSNPDFDGMGSALAIQQYIRHLNKECYIVVNKASVNDSLKKAFDILKNKNMEPKFISRSGALKNASDALLIVLDTHKKAMLEEPKLIDLCSDIVVIDHHIKSHEYIKNTTINYNNSNMSSTVEILTHYFKFVNYQIDSAIATFMLVGLEIDTNTFKLKTTDMTYETAAYLTRMGADNIIKQELLQESKENYLRRHKLIEESFMINDNMAMCLFDSNVYENKDLATVAEELLQFEKVEASFAIGFIGNNKIGVSARSIGTIDVEKIMGKLGGGGHLNEAAAQFEKTTLEKVKQKVIEAIGEI